MNRKSIHIYEGRLMEEEGHLTIRQICEHCHISEEEIVAMVEEGIIEPEGTTRAKWTFEFSSTERVKKVVRLQHDFELNLPGAALAMHLLDKIEELEARLREKNF